MVNAKQASALLLALCGVGVLVVTSTGRAPWHSTVVEADREEHPTTTTATSISPAARPRPEIIGATGSESPETTIVTDEQQSAAVAQPNFNPTSSTAGVPTRTARDASMTSQIASAHAVSAAPSVEVPTEWGITGSAAESYTLQTNRIVPLSGSACAALIASDDADAYRFGALWQAASARDFAGKRLELSGYIASNDAPAGASIWLRADTTDGATVGFENTMMRGIRGTQDWSYQNIVMDIPPGAAVLVYGAVLNGRGTLYVDDLQFRIVDDSVAVTAKPFPSQERSATGVGPRVADAPRNLDFEQSQLAETPRP